MTGNIYKHAMYIHKAMPGRYVVHSGVEQLITQESLEALHNRITSPSPSDSRKGYASMLAFIPAV